MSQYLPNQDQLKKLEEFKAEYDDLAEAEQFAISLADIKRSIRTFLTFSIFTRIFKVGATPEDFAVSNSLS